MIPHGTEEETEEETEKETEIIFFYNGEDGAPRALIKGSCARCPQKGVFWNLILKRLNGW